LKALESNESDDESKEYHPYSDEKINERTSYHPSVVCSNDNSVKVQIKPDRRNETCCEIYCGVSIKQEDIDFRSDKSGGASD